MNITSRRGQIEIATFLYDGDDVIAEIYGRDDSAMTYANLFCASRDLLNACIAVRNYLQSLEDSLQVNDPLRAARKKVHQPLLDKLAPAIAKAQGRRKRRIMR